MRAAGIYELCRRQAEALQAAGIVPVYQPVKPQYAIGSMEWQAQQQQKKDNEGSQ
jgi:hypothetical protein